MSRVPAPRPQRAQWGGLIAFQMIVVGAGLCCLYVFAVIGVPLIVLGVTGLVLARPPSPPEQRDDDPPWPEPPIAPFAPR